MYENDYASFVSRRIIEICIKRGDISIYELSKISGVKLSTIQNIVHCNTKNPGIQTIHKIANGLNMTISEFLNCPEINKYEFKDEEIEEYVKNS
ncbi:helix-turn-helix domain-containing protein [Holdemania massiliensis]|uniref:helix-turn-helix domain-containing protein n=1 Tax=Holdemania massiliensis TaxID=1468449 RepID=UPI003562EC02